MNLYLKLKNIADEFRIEEKRRALEVPKNNNNKIVFVFECYCLYGVAKYLPKDMCNRNQTLNIK